MSVLKDTTLSITTQPQQHPEQQSQASMDTDTGANVCDNDLPNQFQDIPLEFRLLQKKFDHQKIFTQSSNEVRLESRLRSHKYKEENSDAFLRGIATPTSCIHFNISYID